jgi:cytochrome d ubiquinol oxidase subunit II
MEAYFRRRAIAAAVIAGVTALIGIFVLRSDARYLYDELTTRALPLVILSAVCGAASLVLLVRRAERGARIVAIGAAPSGTLTALLVATALFAIIVVPGFILLYVLDQKSLLPEEGAA